MSRLTCHVSTVTYVMNPDTPSSTDLSGLCSILMALTGLGFFVALVCIVFFVVETPSITVAPPQISGTSESPDPPRGGSNRSDSCCNAQASTTPGPRTVRDCTTVMFRIAQIVSM